MSTPIDDVTTAGGQVYWVEGRANGNALVCWSAVGGRRDVLPPEFDVRSAVHEYGGGGYASWRGEVWFVRGDDQRIYRTAAGAVVPVTMPASAGEDRHADLQVTDAGLLCCVRERHRDGRVINELVAMPSDGSATPRVIAGGWDFYSSPRFNADGSRLAWITWRNPLMPWDGSWLWTASVGTDGSLQRPGLVAGGAEESIGQPAWGPAGELYFLSDRSGWWNLYRYRHGEPEDVIVIERDLSPAPWEFGYRTYCPLNGGRVAVVINEPFRQRIAVWNEKTRRLRPISLPYTSIKPYLAADDDGVAFAGFGPDQGATVARIDLADDTLQEIGPGPRSTSVPLSEPIRFPTRDGAHAHALFYPPSEVKAGTPPPLLVRAHPGPTAQAQQRFDPWISFFTGRGFAVVDVDYRGSTGHGRAYRNALRGRWGVLDVADCVDAVTHLGGSGRIDPARVGICGASAGGYTALRAVATTDTFRAAVVRYAVIDPESWRSSAPKFQAHHADLLLGAEPHDRSVLGRSRAITAPVLIVHGELDTVAPVSDARRLAALLGQRATLLTFPGEGHGLRHPEHERHALDAELSHLSRALDA